MLGVYGFGCASCTEERGLRGGPCSVVGNVSWWSATDLSEVFIRTFSGGDVMYLVERGRRLAFVARELGAAVPIGHFFEGIAYGGWLVERGPFREPTGREDHADGHEAY